MMLQHVDPSQVELFRAAIEGKFYSDARALFPESPEPTAESITPEPTAPSVPETTAEPAIEPAIDVKVTETPETPATDAPIKPTAAAPTAAVDIEGLLNKMTMSVNPQAGGCSGNRRERDAGKHCSEVKENRHRVRYLGCDSLTQINN